MKEFYSLIIYLTAFQLTISCQDVSCGYNWLIHEQKLTPNTLLTDTLISPITSYSRTEMVIPVVVHIVWKKNEENIDDQRVFSQIEALNRDFNGENSDLINAPEEFRQFASQHGIRFCLASKSPLGEPSSGIIRVETTIDLIGTKNELYSNDLGGSTAWDTKRYMNIWVADLGDLLTGFGTYPGLVSPEKEGLVIHPKYFGNNSSKRYNLGRVAVHEAGHFFGLQHLWGDEGNCNTDDNIEDTPMQSGPYKGCPAHPQESCNTRNMFMNFMDYVDDECMVMFTNEQMAKMINTIEVIRPELFNQGLSCVQPYDKTFDFEFSIEPNPAQYQLNIKFKNLEPEINRIEIFNIVGQKIYELDTVLFDGITVDLHSFLPGKYILRVGSHAKKLIISSQ